MKKLSIVVPTFNEKDNIQNLVNQVEDALQGIDFEIVFVDDSTDNTPEVIEEIAKVHKNIRCRHRTTEKGLATAVIEGFRIAQGDYLAVMDADLQHPPTILRPMYAAVVSGADFCIPSRFIPGGSDGGLNLYRKMVSGVARYIGKILLPSLRKISDPTSGLFMFKKESIKNADLQPIGWKIMVEVLALADYKTVIEIPYKFQQRPAGESKLSSKVTLQYIEQLIGLMKRGKKQKDVVVKRWTKEKTIKMVEKYEKQK